MKKTILSLLLFSLGAAAQITMPASGATIYVGQPVNICWSMNNGADVLGYLGFSYQGYSNNNFLSLQNLSAAGCQSITPAATGELYVWGQFIRCANGCGAPPDTFQAAYPIQNVPALGIIQGLAQSFNSSGVPADTYSPAASGFQNIALNMPARESSWACNVFYCPSYNCPLPQCATAGQAVDGNMDLNAYDGSVAVTGNLSSNDWWEVDLGQPADIQQIAIWGGNNVFNTALNDYWVFVSNTPFGDTDTPSTLMNRTGTWSAHLTGVPSPETTIPVGGVAGEYVRVQLTNQNYLELAEVQVFGAFDGGGVPASISKIKALRVPSGKTVHIPRGDLIDIGNLHYEYSGAGLYTYTYRFDNSQVAMVRLGAPNDRTFAVSASTQPKNWAGSGDPAWFPLRNPEYSSAASYSLTSAKLPGLQPMYFQGDVDGITAMMNGGPDATGLPMGSTTRDNLAIAAAGGLFSNSLRRFVIGPVFDPGVTRGTVLARVKVWAGYGFSFLAPLLKEGGTLADLEPKNQLERDIVSCLAAVLQ